MAFLTINGLSVPVRDGTVTEKLIEIGERSRAFDGTARVTRRATKRELSFDITPQVQADAIAYEGLIQGDGHVWSFDTASGLYSSKGLGPSAQSGTVTTATPGTPKFSGALRLSGGGAAASISYQPGIGSAWTVAYWRSTDNGTTWTHYVRTSAGTSYVNGVNTGASQSWLSVSAPNLTLTDTSTPTPVSYDDLIFLPFVIPSSWVATLYGKASAWPATPQLTVSGDAVSEARTMLGEITGLRQLAATVGGSFVTNARILSVNLVEV